jgi:hypothetical protein
LKRSETWHALAAAAFALTVSAHGYAFCLTRTCDPTTGNCETDDTGCIISGKPLFWPNSCVSFDVQKDGSVLRGIDAATLTAVSTKAFQQWLDADCGGGTHPGLAKGIANFGLVDCAKPEYNKDQGNANVVTFHDSKWPYPNTAETVALTTVFFNGDTGEIYDANVEINSYTYQFVVGNPTPEQVDLNAVVNHEFGHFLGLSHTNVPAATMYATYNADMATLDPDDERGICASLPPGRSVASDDCTPRHGFSSECGKPETGCCATAIGSTGGSTNRNLGLIVAALGVCAWRGRLRLKRSARVPRR